MKTWWLTLSLREKHMLSVGSFLLVGCLIYLFIWSPIHYHVTTLRKQIQSQKELLIWMQKIDLQIKTYHEQSSSTHATAKSLLSLTQDLIKDTSLNPQLNQLRQGEKDTVHLNFKQVDFDQLIAWIADVLRQKLLFVTQMTVTPSNHPGQVKADLTLKSPLTLEK